MNHHTGACAEEPEGEPKEPEISGSASTGSGGIRSDFPGTFEKRSASFSGGPGAVDVRVSTSSGSVKILEN